MAKSKAQKNAMALDPTRQMIAKNMSVMPGGPQNNNPMNVTDNASPQIKAESIYGDYAQSYPQMGTGMVNPMGINSSGLPQNLPVGRGVNGGVPYGLQQQPDMSARSQVPDAMEAGRLNTGIQKGLPRGPMGYIGMPATPGAMPPAIPNTGGAMLPTLDSMVPGSTPQKTGQKKKGGNK